MVLKIYGTPKVVNSLDTLDYILENNLSVTRFGDGEFNLLNGKSIKFQDYDKRIVDIYKKCLKNDNNKIIVCVPAIYDFKILNTLKYKSRIFWLQYIIDNHNKYVPFMDLSSTYYDACFTRPYIRYNKKNNHISEQLFNKLKKIWDQKDIVIVEGEYSRLGVGNDLFDNAKSLKRILCPSKNAFSKYDEIIKSIKKHCKNKLVILSLGPTATALAWQLANSDIRTIDIGHIDLEYEWYQRKAEEKIDIENKYVNELDQEKEFQELKDKEYKESIIEVIK